MYILLQNKGERQGIRKEGKRKVKRREKKQKEQNQILNLVSSMHPGVLRLKCTNVYIFEIHGKAK
jgi:hypothetical protein